MRDRVRPTYVNLGGLVISRKRNPYRDSYCGADRENYCGAGNFRVTVLSRREIASLCRTGDGGVTSIDPGNAMILRSYSTGLTKDEAFPYVNCSLRNQSLGSVESKREGLRSRVLLFLPNFKESRGITIIERVAGRHAQKNAHRF